MSDFLRHGATGSQAYGARPTSSCGPYTSGRPGDASPAQVRGADDCVSEPSPLQALAARGVPSQIPHHGGDAGPDRTARRHLGGRPRYGYRLADAGTHPNRAHARCGRRLHRLDPDPDTAPTSRWIFAQRLTGRSIARELNERGVPCPSGADPDRNRHRSTQPRPTTTRPKTLLRARRPLVDPDQPPHPATPAVSRAERRNRARRGPLPPHPQPDHRLRPRKLGDRVGHRPNRTGPHHHDLRTTVGTCLRKEIPPPNANHHRVRWGNSVSDYPLGRPASLPWQIALAVAGMGDVRSTGGGPTH
jgi:hypothetical protein